MVRNNWLWAVVGLGLVACGGGSDDDDDMSPATGSTNGGSTGGGTSAGTSNGGTGSTTGGSTGGAACTAGATQACTCADGTSQTQTCAGGVWGACPCTACPQPPVQQCTCPDGSMGAKICMNGTFGECMCVDGIDAGPERACPTGFTCQAVGGGIGGGAGLPAAVCVAEGGGSPIPLPPMCMTDADCVTAGLVGVPCMALAGGFLSVCVQACPAP